MFLLFNSRQSRLLFFCFFLFRFAWLFWMCLLMGLSVSRLGEIKIMALVIFRLLLGFRKRLEGLLARLLRVCLLMMELDGLRFLFGALLLGGFVLVLIGLEISLIMMGERKLMKDKIYIKKAFGKNLLVMVK